MGPTLEAMSAAPADHLFHLFPPLLNSMYKHPMEDDGVMGTCYLPLDVSIQEHVNIHMAFHLTYG